MFGTITFTLPEAKGDPILINGNVEGVGEATQLAVSDPACVAAINAVLYQVIVLALVNNDPTAGADVAAVAGSFPSEGTWTSERDDALSKALSDEAISTGRF